MSGRGAGRAGAAVATRSSRPRGPGSRSAGQARSRDARLAADRSPDPLGHGAGRSGPVLPAFARVADRADPSDPGAGSSTRDPLSLAGEAPGSGPGGGGRLAPRARPGRTGDLPLRSARRPAVAGRDLAQRRDPPSASPVLSADPVLVAVEEDEVGLVELREELVPTDQEQTLLGLAAVLGELDAQPQGLVLQLHGERRAPASFLDPATDLVVVGRRLVVGHRCYLLCCELLSR